MPCFDSLPDPRGSNARYPHGPLRRYLQRRELFALSKANFLSRFLSLPHGTPSHDTFSRVFRHLDPQAFHERFLTFMSDFAAKIEGVVAVDGKSLRRAYDHIDGQSPLQLVNAWQRSNVWYWDSSRSIRSSTKFRLFPRYSRGCRFGGDDHRGCDALSALAF